jgi:hypothetical protein
MLEDGALPEQVDKVMVDFGYPPQRYPNPPSTPSTSKRSGIKKHLRLSGYTRQLVHGDGNDLASLRGGRIRRPKP